MAKETPPWPNEDEPDIVRGGQRFWYGHGGYLVTTDRMRLDPATISRALLRIRQMQRKEWDVPDDNTP